MKIIYLNGPFRRSAYSRSSRSPAVTKSGTIYYPLWLAYAAGWAQRSGEFDIELLDAVARRYDIGDTVSHLQRAGGDLQVPARPLQVTYRIADVVSSGHRVQQLDIEFPAPLRPPRRISQPQRIIDCTTFCNRRTAAAA